VTFHRHEPDFTDYENAVFVGQAEPSPDAGGAFVRVERMLPDVSLTGSRLARIRRFASFQRTVKPRVRAEARRRGQPPPIVRLPRDW